MQCRETPVFFLFPGSASHGPTLLRNKEKKVLQFQHHLWQFWSIFIPVFKKAQTLFLISLPFYSLDKQQVEWSQFEKINVKGTANFQGVIWVWSLDHKGSDTRNNDH